MESGFKDTICTLTGHCIEYSAVALVCLWCWPPLTPYRQMWPRLLLTMSSVLESPNCAKYACASSSQPPAVLSSSTCVFYNASSNSYLSGACDDHYSKYCQLQYAANSTCTLMPEPEPLTSWPGEACLNDTSCLSGNCLGGVCYGVGFNETCENDYDCSPGLFCNNTVCEFLSNLKETCASDYDCLNNAGCNFGLCTPYLSLGDGTAVDMCNDFANLLCQSTLCLTDSGTGKSYCLGTMTSKAALPASCTNSLTCVSNTDPKWTGTNPGVLYSACTCGYNPTGMSYCAAFPGDPVGVTYMTSLKAWINSPSIHLCNTHRRFNQECMQLHWDATSFNTYTSALLSYNYYPALQGIDSCTKGNYLQDYYLAQARINNVTLPSGAGMVTLTVLVWLAG